MRVLMASVLVGGALLAGCSSSRRCEGEQPYQSAETLPTPGAIPGLTIPDSPSSLHIPAQPAQPVPYGKKVADAKGSGTHYECLDVPPRMVAPPEPPAASESAPKTAAEPAKS